MGMGKPQKDRRGAGLEGKETHMMHARVRQARV